MKKKRRFYFRDFTSIFLGLSFINLIISSIVLYIVPPGRVANWTNWKLMGLSKDQWSAMHTIVGYAFIIFAVLHIILNWNVIMNYVRDKVRKSIKRIPELTAAFLLVLWLSLGSIYNWFPLSSVMTLGENLSNSWETKTTSVVNGNNESIQNTQTSAEGTEESEIGRGWGRMTIAEVSKELSVDIDTALSRLEEKGLKTNPDEKMKDLSARYDISFEDISNIVTGK